MYSLMSYGTWLYCNSIMKQWFDIHKKEWEGLLYENGAGQKIVGHPKLKLWTFFLGHGERKWPLAELEVNMILA